MPKFLSARVSISPRNIAKPSINNNVAVSEICIIFCLHWSFYFYRFILLF